MTIRAKVRIDAIIEIIFAILAGIALTFSLLDIRLANDKAAQMSQINQAIAEMRFVTFENILHPEERSAQQWQLKYDDVSSLLGSLSSLSPAEQNIINDIRSRHKETKAIFERLRANLVQPPTGQEASVTSHLKERLATQLLIKQQAQLTGTNALSGLNQSEIKSRQERIAWLLVAMSVVLVAIRVSYATLITRGVTNSLSKLQEGAEAVAAGNLVHRVELKRKDEFGQLSESFNSMASSLQQIDKMKSQFITIAAHQLRTPVNVMLWNLEELLGGSLGKTTEAQEKILRAAYKANGQIIARIDDLLVAIAIETQGVKLEKQTSSPAGLLRSVMTELSDDFKIKKIRPEASYSRALPPMEVDLARLRGVFRKFIENSLAYTEERGKISVKLSKKGQSLHFEINDSGIGIPEAEQANIFRRFVRASNAFTMIPDASGLGLYIAQHVISAHGGTVGFTSKESKGSTFWFEIPFVMPQATTAEPLQPPTSPSKSKTTTS